MTRAPDWGMIGRFAVLTSLVVAVVLFFALPDERWIAAVLVGLAIVDGLIFGFLMPRLQSGGTGGAPSLDELEPMNEEAERPAAPGDAWAERKPDDA